jgi:hypothetical protein
MSLTLPYTLASGAVVDSNKLNSNFGALADKFDGGIDNSDIRSGAAISISKLSASYEYMTVKFRLDDMTVAYTGAATPVGGPYRLDVCPIYNDGKGDWTYVATSWATQDTGAPVGVFKVFWATFTGGAASTTPALTIISTVDTIALAGVEIQSQGSDAAPAVSTLASGTDRCLVVGVSTVDAAATSPVWISCTLKRQIAT